jgi:hypothetical protein
MAFDIERRTEEIMGQIQKNPHLNKYIDRALKIPRVFRGTGDIKLVILGQDPTVENPASRKGIDVVLNLDCDGALRAYLEQICIELEIDLDKNVYATNCMKNFFTDPPTKLAERKILLIDEAFSYWLPLLLDELDVYPNVPTITLGEPILASIVHRGHDHKVRDYWGYSPDWKEEDGPRHFRFIKPDENILKRPLYPFPHQPSLGLEFYQAFLSDYVKFMINGRS